MDVFKNKKYCQSSIVVILENFKRVKFFFVVYDLKIKIEDRAV